jgi:hypothetical protein
MLSALAASAATKRASARSRTWVAKVASISRRVLQFAQGDGACSLDNIARIAKGLNSPNRDPRAHPTTAADLHSVQTIGVW